jgi:hypothetical protein
MIISLAVALLLVLTLAGFVALRHAHASAVDGYEDENGFHFGTAPRPLQLAARVHKTHARAARPAPAVSPSHAAAGIHAGSHI